MFHTCPSLSHRERWKHTFLYDSVSLWHPSGTKMVLKHSLAPHRILTCKMDTKTLERWGVGGSHPLHLPPLWKYCWKLPCCCAEVGKKVGAELGDLHFPQGLPNLHYSSCSGVSTVSTVLPRGCPLCPQFPSIAVSLPSSSVPLCSPTPAACASCSCEPKTTRLPGRVA